MGRVVSNRVTSIISPDGSFATMSYLTVFDAQFQIFPEKIFNSLLYNLVTVSKHK